VVIPLVLHRLRKRELPRVVLPTFALLSRAVAKSQQKQAFTDIWLLAARIALIAAAAFALAIPYITRQLTFGDGRLASVVIVIDDTLSMARIDAGKSIIGRARSRALEVVQALPQGSELAVILGGKPARVWIPLGRDLASAQRMLSETELPAVRENDLAQAIELAQRQQTRGLVSPQRILVLSDFAGHVTQLAQGTQGTQETNAARTLPSDASITYERVGGPPTKPNLYIASTHVSVDPAHPAETSIAVEVAAAFGSQPSERVEARVEVELQGAVAQSQAISVEHGAAQTKLRVPSPLPSQTLEARVRVVVDDALAADNQVSVVLGHADALQLLVVNGDPRPASRTDELFYAGRALALLSDGQLSMRVQTADPLSFEHSDLTDVDVIIMANVTAPDAALAKRLVEYVHNGGGLIVAAGSRMDATLYNARLEAVLPAHLRGTTNCDALRLAAPDHSTFLSDGQTGLHEVRSQQRLLVDILPSAETLLSYEDGAPALCARSEGDGRTLLLSTSLDTDYSDLPLRPGYLPLLAAMVRDAAGATAASRSRVTPGERFNVPSPKAGRYVEVRGPNGKAWRFSSTHAAEKISFTQTDALGMYSIRAGHLDDGSEPRLRASFVVDPPRDESDVSPGPVPDSAGNSGEARSVKPVDVHVPCSPWLWLTVFVLVASEGVLRARKRWGEHPARAS
jgi:hypothetical protein